MKLVFVCFLIHIIIILLRRQNKMTSFSCPTVSFVLQGIPGPRGQDGRPVRLSLFFGHSRINFFSVHGLNNETSFPSVLSFCRVSGVLTVHLALLVPEALRDFQYVI